MTNAQPVIVDIEKYLYDRAVATVVRPSANKQKPALGKNHLLTGTTVTTLALCATFAVAASPAIVGSHHQANRVQQGDERSTTMTEQAGQIVSASAL